MGRDNPAASSELSDGSFPGDFRSPLGAFASPRARPRGADEPSAHVTSASGPGPGAGDLTGRVALITGATSGLGLEAAAQLAARGAKVIFGVRNPQKAERVARLIREKVPTADLVYPPAVPPLDVAKPASIVGFATAMLSDTSTPLHILINNAGTSMLPGPVVDDRGVNNLVQVNYLGPYSLTRLLEAKLVACRTRVVTVSSVTHRSYELPRDPRDFVHTTARVTYAWTKLANVLFAYELQRRLGPLGVQSCAVDPGGVRTSIWDAVPLLSRPPARWVIETLYAPPSDGAEVLVRAATVPWEQDKAPHVLSPADDLRYYARGAFASPAVTLPDGAWRTWYGVVRPSLYGASLIAHSLLDYPVRNWSGRRMFNRTVPVRSALQTYDTRLAADLWSYSERVAGVGLVPLAGGMAEGPAGAGERVAGGLGAGVAGGGNVGAVGAVDGRPPLEEAAKHVGGGSEALQAMAAAASVPFGSSSRRATVDGAEAAENGNGGGEGELSGGESPQATPSRKRPVMSPVATTRSAGGAHAYARPLFPTLPPSVGAPNTDAASAGTPLGASPGVPSVAATASGSRRNVVYARRTTPEPELPAAGGSPVAGHVSRPPAGEDMYGNLSSAPANGSGAVQGLSSVPVEVPEPPEAFQQLAARHGIVLPGPEHVAAEEEAARQLEAAGARPGAVPLPPSAVAVAMAAGVPYTPVPTFVQDTPAEPPPYKRLHYAEGGQGEGPAGGKPVGALGAAASPRRAPFLADARIAVDNDSSGTATEPPAQLPVTAAAVDGAVPGAGGGAEVLDSGDFVRAATSSGGGSIVSGSSGRDSGGGGSDRTRPAGGSETSWEDIGSVGSPARQQGGQAAGVGAKAGNKKGGKGRQASEAAGGEAGGGAAGAGVTEQQGAAAGVVGGDADVVMGAGGSQGGDVQGVGAGTKAGAGGSGGGGSGGGSGGGVPGERSGGGSKSKHKKKGGKGK